MLDEPQASSVHTYSDVRGDEELRHELKRYLYRSRGVNCETEQIVICSGTQLALEIIIRIFAGEKIVAMEEPTYNGASSVFKSNNFKILPVPVNKDGIDLKRLASLSAPIVHIAPSHQFPTGAVMIDEDFQLSNEQLNGYLDRLGIENANQQKKTLFDYRLYIYQKIIV